MLNILLIYRGQVFDKEISPTLELYKHDNIVLVVENLITKNIISRGLIGNIKNRKVITVNEFLEGVVDNMGFDFKLGNPPYQGIGTGQNNKIYNQICKKTLSLPGGKYNDVTELITPTSVLKKSKRFSLIGQKGLNKVDLTTDDAFDVGVTICSWRIDKRNHTDKVEVINKNGTEYFNYNEMVFDSSVVSRDFISIYTRLKEMTPTPETRMFKQNLVPSSDTRTKNNDEYKYSWYKIDKARKEEFVYYVKREPHFIGEKKFVISRTKRFDESSTIVSYNDFSVAHMFTNIEEEHQVDNIKSFLFSEYFITHSEQWKLYNGNGFNDALIYLPPFDKTKSWTNEEVKAFIESFG